MSLVVSKSGKIHPLFGILGVALLFLSLLLVSRAIARPAGCALLRTTDPRQE